MRVNCYEIDGKRVIIAKIPGPSDYWHDATPSGKFWTVVFIVIAILINGMMDHFSLKFGNVASEMQLARGSLATAEQKTGPQINYWTEAFDMVKAEAVRQDGRIKKEDIQQQYMPDRNKMWYRGVNDFRVGYIGGSRYQLFFSYYVRNSGKSQYIAGYGIIRLDQKPVWVFVKQEWVVEKFVVTHRE